MDALPAAITKGVENQPAFGPKSRVGLFSIGWLDSCRNAVPQIIWPTPNCSALDLFPNWTSEKKADGSLYERRM